MFIAHLSLIFSFQFVIVAVLFFMKKQSRTGNVLIGLVMGIISFQHFMHYLWASRKVYEYTWLMNIDLPLDGCMAPLLLLYIRAMTGERLSWHWKELLHFWPLPAGLVWYIYFNLQPKAFQYNFIDNAYREVPVIAAVVNIMVAIYLAAGYKKLKRYIAAQPTTEWASGYSNLEWLKQFIGMLFIINVCAAPANLIAKFDYIFVAFPVLMAFIMLFIVYKTFNHPEVLTSELIRKFNKQLEYQREIEKVRGQISTDIHDELGAGLTRISMISSLEQIKNKGNIPVQVAFKDVADISGGLMYTLKEVVWAINPLHDNLSSMQAFLRQYVSRFFEPTDVRINMDFEDKVDEVKVDPIVRRNLILIVKEACNNIIKHSNATEVSIRCAVEGKMLLIEIKNNGVEISAGNRLGNGLKGMEKRAGETGGRIEINNRAGKKFELKIWCLLEHIT